MHLRGAHLLVGSRHPGRVCGFSTMQKADENMAGHEADIMAVAVDIRTGERSILSYLISPIEQASREAGRER